MVESDIATDMEVKFSELYNKYKDPAISKDKKHQIRDQLLNMVPHLPYPETAIDLATEFGPEAVYSRLNQLHKDQLARQGYSELGGLISLYERLEAISELNKGTNPKQGDGQVTLFSGQFVHSDIDLMIKGKGLDFEFRRTYKSQVTYSGPLGANWDHSYNLWLRIEDSGARVVRSTGSMSEDTYERDDNDSSIYTIPNGFFSKLTHDIVSLPGLNLGTRYILETIDGTRYIYKEIPYSNGLYKVEYIVDRLGNRMSFEYDNNNKGRLETIIDTLGKTIEFFYDDRDRIIEIKDKDRSVFYYYDDNNDLICVKKPEPEPGKEAPVPQYEYSSYDKPKEFLHNLVAIIDPQGNRYLENEYGATKGLLSFNRIVKQRNGQGEFLYEYRDLYSESSGEDEIGRPRHKTIVTKRNNQIVEYIFNSHGNLLKMTECIRGVGKLVVPVSTEYRYNKDGNMIWMKDPVGKD
jgi:YD repeat-containing protein